MATVRNPGTAEALAAAAQLAVQGRFLDAVELLTEANRRETDPEIETWFLAPTVYPGDQIPVVW